MARLLTEGFEFGDAGGVTVVAGTTFVTATPSPRSGVYCAKMGNTPGSFSIGLSPTAEVYERFAWQTSTLQAARILKWLSSSTELGSVRITTAGKIEVYNTSSALAATGTRTLSTGTWYLIEVHVKINDSTGVIEVKVDGIVDVTFSGDTKPGAQTTIDALVHLNDVSSITFTAVDDIAVNDTTGGADNGYPGDGKIIRLAPNADGDVSQLLGSDGNSTNNYLLVDEVPHNSDTDYVYETVVDKYDLYNLAACGLTNATIIRTWSEARAQGASGDKIAMVIKTGGTEYQSSDINLPTTYGRVVAAERLTNPFTTVAWVAADLDALQVGPKVR